MKRVRPSRRFQPWAEHDQNAQAQYGRGYGKSMFAPLPSAALAHWQRHRLLKPFRVISSGYYGRAVGHRWERAGLPEAVLIYCVAGAGGFECEGRRRAVTAGDLLYCAPDTHHRYEADRTDPWSIYWIHLAGAKATGAIRLIGLSRRTPIVHVGHRPEVTALFEELFSLRQIRYSTAQLYAMRCCAEHLLARFVVAQKYSPTRRQEAARWGEVLERMQQGLAEGFSLRKVAAEFGTSPGYFHRLFRQQTGATPAKYYRQQQIRRACSLLTDSRLRIKEVSALVGIPDPYHFSRLFRQHTGVAPKAWRSAALHRKV